MNMRFNTYGNRSNPIIIMLTSSFCSADSLSYLYEELTNDYYIIVPEYNGHYEGSSDFTTSQQEAKEIVGFLKENGIKIALATATAPDRAERCLTRVGLFSYLDAVVCASMVKKGKPEPDIYLKAASELGLKPEECIAVEDSPNGIISAYRAGCRAVMIPDMDEPDEDTLRLLFRKGETLRDVRKLVCEELKNCAES